MKDQLEKINRTGWFFRYLCVVTAVCLCAVFLMAQSGGITTKDPRAKEVVDAALKALGGADRIDGIKSLIIKGTLTRTTSMPANWVNMPFAKTGTSTGEFEIRILLPDSYIQISRFPDRTAYSGISQGKVFTPIRVAGPDGKQMDPSDPALNPAMARFVAGMMPATINNAIADMSRFLTGTLVKAGPAPITLSSGTSSGVLNMSGGAVGEIEFDSKTGYPSVIRYRDISPRGGIGEIRFSDRFSVNGIMFPRVISEATSTSKSEMRIEEVLINPRLSLKDFEVSRQ